MLLVLFYVMFKVVENCSFLCLLIILLFVFSLEVCLLSLVIVGNLVFCIYFLVV